MRKKFFFIQLFVRIVIILNFNNFT